MLKHPAASPSPQCWMTPTPKPHHSVNTHNIVRTTFLSSMTLMRRIRNKNKRKLTGSQLQRCLWWSLHFSHTHIFRLFFLFMGLYERNSYLLQIVNLWRVNRNDYLCLCVTSGTSSALFSGINKIHKSSLQTKRKKEKYSLSIYINNKLIDSLNNYKYYWQKINKMWYVI